MRAYQLLLKILQVKLGLIISVDEEGEFAISDYISDSLMFIQFIVAIEEELGEDLPDDFLLFEILSSAKGFTEKLDFFITSQRNDSSIIHEHLNFTD